MKTSLDVVSLIQLEYLLDSGTLFNHPKFSKQIITEFLFTSLESKKEVYPSSGINFKTLPSLVITKFGILSNLPFFLNFNEFK